MPKKLIEQAQKTELTEFLIYSHLAKKVQNEHNKNILLQIATEEKKHHDFWKTFTQKDVSPYKGRIWLYKIIIKIFGLTFGIKLMEHQEVDAQKLYTEIANRLPQNQQESQQHIQQIIKDEEEHEKTLLNLIVEDRFKYIGSMVLGLNDALVELTGALAGLTLALRDTKIIAMVGLITGVAASFSMAASEYLSIKAENEDGRNPFKGALYTGVAYILTVLILITPFLLIQNVYHSLATSIGLGILIIALFTYYTAIAQDTGFKKRFFEMAILSLGVAAISFGFGYLIKNMFGIDV